MPRQNTVLEAARVLGASPLPGSAAAVAGELPCPSSLQLYQLSQGLAEILRETKQQGESTLCVLLHA